MSPPFGVLGTGSYLPKEEVANEEVAGLAGVSPEWIERKTHIRTRRRAAPDEAASDLAARAAVDALERAGIDAARIGYLIVCTSTGDHPQPATANIVQDLIGAPDAACFDINAVCSGFVYGLETARGLLALHPERLALVIGVDVYSRILDPADRRTAVLFGDGAGAAIVGAVEAPYGILATSLRSSGFAHRMISVGAGGSRRPASAETIAEGAHYFRMAGREVREFVLEHVPPAVAGLLAEAGAGPGDVDHFVPHQPNGVLLTELVVAAGLDLERSTVHRTVERYANVGSASVPVTLDQANRSGALADGDLVLLTAFGGGMAIGACLLRWGGAA